MFILLRQKIKDFDDSPIIVNSNQIALIEETEPNGNLILYLTEDNPFGHIEIKETLKDLKNIPAFKHMFE